MINLFSLQMVDPQKAIQLAILQIHRNGADYQKHQVTEFFREKREQMILQEITQICHHQKNYSLPQIRKMLQEIMELYCSTGGSYEKSKITTN